MNKIKKLKHPATLLFLLCLTALTVWAYAYNRLHSAERNSSVRLKAALSPLNPESVREIQISWLKNVLTLASDDGRWVLRERENAQASTAVIVAFLEDLAKLKPLKEIENYDEETLKELNLSDHPDGINGAGVNVRLLDDSGTEVLNLILGRAHMKIDPEQIGNYRMQTYDGRYVRIRNTDGGDRVFLISRVFEKCHPSPRFWLEQLHLANLTDIMQLRFSSIDADGNAQQRWMVMNDNRGSYVLIDPPRAELSLQELSDKLTLLSTSFSSDVLPADEAAELKNFALFQAVLNNGIVYQLHFARAGEGEVFATLDTAFLPEKMLRRPGENDRDYTRRQQILAAKTEYEKRAYQGRYFLVGTEPLNKLEALPVQKPSNEAAAPALPGGAITRPTVIDAPSMRRKTN